MERRPEVGLRSYDRFFPNQDTLPKGGFGNLIALPLQKRPRDSANSVFVDVNLAPYADQWAFFRPSRGLIGPRSSKSLYPGRTLLATVRVERRLTTMLAADVAGYSRLTGLDEEGTHAQLQEHLGMLVDPKIAEHRGRLVKNIGDGLLAEFSSVVEAVRCAVEVQRGMAERNAEVPQDKRIEFRPTTNSQGD
jgi:hypothetical protein